MNLQFVVLEARLTFLEQLLDLHGNAIIFIQKVDLEHAVESRNPQILFFVRSAEKYISSVSSQHGKTVFPCTRSCQFRQVSVVKGVCDRYNLVSAYLRDLGRADLLLEREAESVQLYGYKPLIEQLKSPKKLPRKSHFKHKATHLVLVVVQRFT